MAVPDQQFQTIIDQIDQTVQDSIAAALKQAKPPPFLDLDEFREQLLESVRSELRVFKEEFLHDLEQRLPETLPAVTPGTLVQPQSAALKDRVKQWW